MCTNSANSLFDGRLPLWFVRWHTQTLTGSRSNWNERLTQKNYLNATVFFSQKGKKRFLNKKSWNWNLFEYIRNWFLQISVSAWDHHLQSLIKRSDHIFVWAGTELNTCASIPSKTSSCEFRLIVFDFGCIVFSIRIEGVQVHVGPVGCRVTASKRIETMVIFLRHSISRSLSSDYTAEQTPFRAICFFLAWKWIAMRRCKEKLK